MAGSSPVCSTKQNDNAMMESNEDMLVRTAHVETVKVLLHKAAESFDKTGSSMPAIKMLETALLILKGPNQK